MSIINELNLLKVISRDDVDIHGLQERFIAFDEKSSELLRGILSGLMSKNFIQTEIRSSETKSVKGSIKLTDKGVEYLKTRI